MAHHENKTDRSKDDWYTPRWVLDALPAFDLDPCGAPAELPWQTAAQVWRLADGRDGLRDPWPEGRVFLNPPFSQVRPFLEKLARHGNGIAIVAGRVETAWFHNLIWGRADGIFFPEKRINYCGLDGLPVKGVGFPSVLVAYGFDNARLLAQIPLPGAFVTGWFRRS
jgi:hypothetical protein